MHFERFIMSKEKEVKQVIVMRRYFPDPKDSTKQKQVRTGKYIAQGAHASTAVLSEIIRKSKNSGNVVKLTEEQQLKTLEASNFLTFGSLSKSNREQSKCLFDKRCRFNRVQWRTNSYGCRYWTSFC